MRWEAEGVTVKRVSNGVGGMGRKSGAYKSTSR